MSRSSEDRGAELRALFFESASELLQSLNEAGMELESRPADEEVIRRVRRIVHTLKGDSAACGFNRLSELTHELEDVLTLQSAINYGVKEVYNESSPAIDVVNAILADVAQNSAQEKPRLQ